MTTGIVSAYNQYEDIGLVRETETDTTEQGQLGLKDFMNLLVTELTHQDPFKPMENSEMATQVSQFATVSGIGDLNDSFSDLKASLTSNQALQAASLVGREVLVESNVGVLTEGEAVQGSLQLPSSASNITLRVTNSAGELVRELPLGTHEAGNLSFSWDGFDDSGNYAGDGYYQITASASVDDAEMAPTVLVSAQVESVNLSGTDGVQLNLDGLGQVSINDVVQIQ
ncbi:MAG: flagellar hook assembly protein FlgD [Candidatus Thiodiazotropha sp.]